MDHYRRTAHTRYDLKYHFVWITKYRKKLLRADVAVRLRQLVRDICTELEVEILKGPVSNSTEEEVRGGVTVTPLKQGVASRAGVDSPHESPDALDASPCLQVVCTREKQLLL